MQHEQPPASSSSMRDGSSTGDLLDEEQRMGSGVKVEVGPKCYLRWDLIGQFAWKQRDRDSEKEGG